MSAILSADDLNDFISPGVACVKPVESLPRQSPSTENGALEVSKDGEDASEARTAEISLTDCLACSGCVTSAEAVLVSLQSHAEVLATLDRDEDLILVASVSPQVRASIAATYGITQRKAGYLIEQLLGGAEGLGRFRWIFDTNAMREANLVLGAEEVDDMAIKRPVLTSACPGWICYAEKTHPHVLPHLSRLKSPQALTGTLLKSVLSQKLHVSPDRIWHLAVMPCFDKKLEASRAELTSQTWSQNSGDKVVRDVDCVITAREILMLADSRAISFPKLPQTPLKQEPFPDPFIDRFLRRPRTPAAGESGTSGGYLHHILNTQTSSGSTLTTTRGRNADVVEYSVDNGFKAARYYGFRNIQNLVRKLKPPRSSRMPGAVQRPKSQATLSIDYRYVEVMACPGGCTNGGGQIKHDDLPQQWSQKEFLAEVDEAYFSLSEEETDPDDRPKMNDEVHQLLEHWVTLTGISLDQLVRTSYRAVESDVGKPKASAASVIELAGKIGGGW